MALHTLAPAVDWHIHIYLTCLYGMTPTPTPVLFRGRDCMKLGEVDGKKIGCTVSLLVRRKTSGFYRCLCPFDRTHVRCNKTPSWSTNVFCHLATDRWFPLQAMRHCHPFAHSGASKAPLTPGSLATNNHNNNSRNNLCFFSGTVLSYKRQQAE